MPVRMMIVMTPQATQAEIEAVQDRLAQTGVHVVVMPGELTTAIGAIGDPEGVAELGLEGMGGVDRVVPISRPYKLASSELNHFEPPWSRSAADGWGAPGASASSPAPARSSRASRRSAWHAPCATAGRPCCAAARSSRARRRSPSRASGAGPRDPGRGAGETGLPVVSELLDAQHADAVAEHVDVVQIGARNMQNYALLEVAGKLGKPVLLKRGLSSSLDELLQAADYVLKEGNSASSSASAGSGRSRRRRASRSTSARSPGSSSTRTCPWSSTPATPRATAAWWSRCRARRPRSAPTASSSRSTRTPRRAVRRTPGAAGVGLRGVRGRRRGPRRAAGPDPELGAAPRSGRRRRAGRSPAWWSARGRPARPGRSSRGRWWPGRWSRAARPPGRWARRG